MIGLCLVFLNWLTPVVKSSGPLDSQDYEIAENITYRTEPTLTDYMKERCRLDCYYPIQKKGFATVVWFHGGGLKAGQKSIPEQLKKRGIAVVAVNYRLSPKVKAPAYIDDAAAAVAWTFRNIGKYGGDPKKIFIAGHSAGGYLTSMIGLDRRWLKKYDINANDLAGLIPYSGHTITHFTVRAERGQAATLPIVDEYAPLYHIRKDAAPICMITGDREKEMLGRYEENAYFWRMLKVVGHPQVTLYELNGFNHGGMAKPAHELLIKFIHQQLKQK